MTTGSPRRQDLDLMRATVVGGLIFFHTARIFDPLDFYVKDQPPNLPLTLFVLFAGLWGMPLLFVVSGLGAWYSLRSRTATGFVRERLARLLVPFLVGLLLVVPPQVYYQLRFEQQDPGSYWQFYRDFFQVRLGLNFPWFVRPDDPPDLFEPAHLWFLYFLLVYSLLLLPLLLYLRGAGQQLLERLASFCSRPWTILLLALPVAVIEAALGTEESGGWNRYAFIPFLLYGFLLAADPRFGEAIRRHARAALLVGIPAMVVLLGLGFYVTEVAGQDRAVAYDGWSVLWRFVKGIGAWAWIVVIMGAAMSMVRSRQQQPAPAVPRQLRPNDPADGTLPLRDRAIGYANQAVLPIYVLHQTVIVMIGFYVVQWDVPTLVKYLVISCTALLATLVLYDVGVRRTAVTHMLFGMKRAGLPKKLVNARKAVAIARRSSASARVGG
jgi:fucose 4-O-acetylase-like acetyltransferase